MTKTQDKRTQSENEAGALTSVFGLCPDSPWLKGSSPIGQKERRGFVCVIGREASLKDVSAASKSVPAWALERAERRRGELQNFVTEAGPTWLLWPAPVDAVGASSHGGQLALSPYGAARDLAGGVAGAQFDQGLEELHVTFVEVSEDEMLGALVGLELGAYKYKPARTGRPALPRLVLESVPSAIVEQAATLGASINLARHLVNVPPAELHPRSFADAAVTLFERSETMRVSVWRDGELEKEGLGLLRAVGSGAVHGPALVHLSYRPRASGAQIKPIAFVGKGITFDSGGLNLKDSGSMRLMKKDMGGAASVLGLAYWVERAGLGVPCDFYLALAENAVDKHSFHPGDVLTARSGLTVEIDNTDAEGRLVLADALDVAVKKNGGDAPAAVINLATLTGAMRVALGTRLAGMFASDDRLASQLLVAAQRRADPAWRMPLVAEYWPQLKSVTADFANSGPGRFGGAITAALFLQRFVGTTPWAHFDMYAWAEAGTGGVSETGGNGQCIQLLADFLTDLAGGALSA